MADDTDDDTPPAKSSKKGPKKRFGERDDSDDEGDDRPRKKKRPADDEDADDDTPRSKRKTNAEDEDADDDKPRKKGRAGGGDKRVTGNEGIPMVMLLAFIGSAVALLGICAGCGWLSFAWAFPGSGGGGGGWGGGGNEFEVVSANRQQDFRRPSDSNVTWVVKTKQTPASSGYYFVVVEGSGGRTETQIMGMAKGEERSSTSKMTGTVGPVDVWVEHRTTPLATGKKVSNTHRSN